MLPTEAIGIESQSNEFPELEPFKMAREELIEYLPYIYHPKMDSENEQSYHQVKTQRFVLDNKHKCQIRNHFSTHISLPASAILFRKLCRLFHSIFGRAEDNKSKALEMFFQFRQLYRWPKRTGYLFTQLTLTIYGDFWIQKTCTPSQQVFETTLLDLSPEFCWSPLKNK